MNEIVNKNKQNPTPSHTNLVFKGGYKVRDWLSVFACVFSSHTDPVFMCINHVYERFA